VSRRESTRLVRDRRGGTVSQDPLVAGQRPEGRVGRAAVVIAGRWARVRASSASLLVHGSNTVRTCVQGFVAFRRIYKSVTCGDSDLRVQEHRSVGSGTGAVARSGCRTRSLRSVGFPVGCATSASLSSRCSVSSPRHLEPCMRFSRTRLTDAVHRRHSVFPASTYSVWV
jgi:hypothetical protein